MFKIEKCTLVDADSLEMLAKQIWSQHFIPIVGAEQVNYMLDKFQSKKAFENQMKNEGFTYFKLIADHEMVGYMGVIFNEKETFLSKLYITFEQRGKGYASKAFQFLMEECKNINCNTIWLTCNKDNTDTINTYKHLGFEVFDSVVKDIGNGYVMDDYYLRKTF